MEIVVETRQTAIIRQPGRRVPTAWCDACAAEVRMVTPEEATGVAGVSARTVYGWAESGRVHFAETPEGLLLVCLDSLTARGDL